MSDAAETIGDRIRMVRGRLTQEAFSTQLGVTKNTIGKYERGERRPEAEVLARMHEVLGVDVNWLLTGAGQMLRDAPPAPAAGAVPEIVDEALSGAVFEAVARAYEEAGARVTGQAGRVAARIYAEITAAGFDTWEEKMAALRLAALQVRRRLATANDGEDGGASGKQSA